MKLILASASYGRKHLLNLLKIPYSIMPTGINEENITGKTPLETIQLRAKAKAEQAVSTLNNLTIKQFNHQSKWLNGSMTKWLILSADTEVVFNNQLIGKPKDFEDGMQILKLLSGKTHEVITAFYIIKTYNKSLSSRHAIASEIDRQNFWQNYDRSLVTFRKLKNEEIDRYLHMTEFTRYTGGYALLASPQDFVIRTEGSLSNIIGLPLEKVIPILRENRLLD